MLFLIGMVFFIVYNFYIDYGNWSNTGNTFAEGMANPVRGKGNLISIVSASQSSTGWGGEANRIVRDSGWNDNYGSGKCTHTINGGRLFAYLDGRYDVTEVQILNRRDCCSGRIKNAKVYVLDGEKKHLCGVVATGNKGWLTVICPTEAVGNTIEVSTVDTNQHLTICGMKVWGNTVSNAGAAADLTIWAGDNSPGDKDNSPEDKDNSPEDKDNSPEDKDNSPEDKDTSSKSKSQPTDLSQTTSNNPLFTKEIMKTVLGNKNLIPEDINITQDKQSNFIRIGKGFMNDLSNIRNVSLPNIDNDDFESLGRVIAKIKIHESEKIEGPQSKVTQLQLINSVNNILAGTTISNSQLDWETPRSTSKMTTTGMYNDNSNSMLGYGDKATKHHTEKPQNGLCLWKGCEKNEKGKPYDSIYSLY